MRPIEGIWAGVIQTPTVTPTFTPSSTVTQTVGASPTMTPSSTPTPTPTPTVTPSIHSQWVAENMPGSWVAAAGTNSSTNNYVIADSGNVYVSDDGITFTLNTSNFPIDPITAVKGFGGDNAGIFSYAVFGSDPNNGRSLVYYSDATTNNPITWNAATMNLPVTVGSAWGQVAYFYNNNQLWAIAARPGFNENTYAYCEAAIFASGWTTYIPYAETLPAPTDFPLTAYGVAYGTVDGGRWVLTASDGLWVSEGQFTPFTPGGTSWVLFPSLGSAHRKLSLCAFSPALLLYCVQVVDTSGASPVTNFYTSPDSQTWTYRTPALPINGFSTFYWDPVAANFIGGVNNNGNQMYHSFDGINWFVRPCPDIFVDSLAGGVNGPIAVGFNGNIQRYGF